MLAATNMLKPPPAVIGSVNKEITLPRTVKLTTVVIVGAGVVLGLTAALLVFGPGINALIYGPVGGGVFGWAAANYSPLQGESLATWLGLQVNGSRKPKVTVDGTPVRLYVGIAPLRRTAAGTIRMLPGGVSVDAVRWDPRGLPLQEIPGSARLSRTRRPRRSGLTASTHLTGGRAGRPPRNRRRARSR